MDPCDAAAIQVKRLPVRYGIHIEVLAESLVDCCNDSTEAMTVTAYAPRFAHLEIDP